MKTILLKYKWEVILVILGFLLLFTPLKSHLKRIFALATEIKVDSKGEKLSEESLSTTTFTGINVSNFSLIQHQEEVIFIHYWATWCPDCVLELPEIYKFYQKYKNQLTIILVAVEKDKTYQKLNDFLKKNNYDFPVYVLEKDLSIQLHPLQFPTTIIIDKNNVIRSKKVGATDWNNLEIQKQIDSFLP